jgi:hypothetical protein
MRTLVVQSLEPMAESRAYDRIAPTSHNATWDRPLTIKPSRSRNTNAECRPICMDKLFLPLLANPSLTAL